VVTDNDPDRARALAQRLSDRLWNARDRLRIDLPGPAEAVRQALEAPAPSSGHQVIRSSGYHPTVLVDMGDNIGGGSAGDSTFLLDELFAQGAAGWVMTLADPAAVAECVRAGVGQPVSLTVGGKTDTLHGSPVTVRGRVRSVHEGTYEDPERRHGGQRRYDQGLTAVVAVSHQPSAVGDESTPPPTADSPRLTASYLVLTSRRHPPFSLEQLVSLGIRPERQQMLVVKAAIAYRAAYEPIAGRIFEVNSPGLTCIDPAAFTYTHARRPLWGLE
jgi:microcystin degradation protein MlrC